MLFSGDQVRFKNAISKNLLSCNMKRIELRAFEEIQVFASRPGRSP